MTCTRVAAGPSLDANLARCPSALFWARDGRKEGTKTVWAWRPKSGRQGHIIWAQQSTTPNSRKPIAVTLLRPAGSAVPVGGGPPGALFAEATTRYLTV